MKFSKSLVIVQPYIPKYRVSFFERLSDTLAEEGIACKVAASDPANEQGLRGDAVCPDWVKPIVQRRLAFAGKSIGLGGARSAWKGADGVIVGHLGSSLDTYLALAESRTFGRLRVGLWGHIRSYVNDGHPLDLALERWQLRQASHVFAYTPGGAAYAQDAGVDEKRITTVMNAVNTDSLSEAQQQVTEQEVKALVATYGLVPGRTLAFWGGLDQSKRIDFLAEVLDQLWIDAPDIKILVGGSGSQAILLHKSVERGQAFMLGVISQAQQAAIARVASAILMPGRIGLIAVDALVLGLPIITTDWPYHSAEAEYLVEGQTRITSGNDVDSYAAVVRDFLSHRRRSPQHPVATQPYPTIDKMVENYASGVVRMLMPVR